jgi:metallo-beta-lactamase family protein
MLYHLAIMFHRGVERPFHVYLDSPMAIEASKEMVTHPELFNEELLEWKSRGLLPLDKAWFQASVTARDSQSLNDVEGPCLILAGAGMCNRERILHHLPPWPAARQHSRLNCGLSDARFGWPKVG